jgi:hypothetical protein
MIISPALLSLQFLWRVAMKVPWTQIPIDEWLTLFMRPKCSLQEIWVRGGKLGSICGKPIPSAYSARPGSYERRRKNTGKRRERWKKKNWEQRIRGQKWKQHKLGRLKRNWQNRKGRIWNDSRQRLMLPLRRFQGIQVLRRKSLGSFTENVRIQKPPPGYHLEVGHILCHLHVHGPATILHLELAMNHNLLDYLRLLKLLFLPRLSYLR